jgi:hypothetical protein
LLSEQDRLQMGQKGREKIIGRFCIDKVIHEYRRIIAQVS